MKLNFNLLNHSKSKITSFKETSKNPLEEQITENLTANETDSSSVVRIKYS